MIHQLVLQEKYTERELRADVRSIWARGWSCRLVAKWQAVSADGIYRTGASRSFL